MCRLRFDSYRSSAVKITDCCLLTQTFESDRGVQKEALGVTVTSAPGDPVMRERLDTCVRVGEGDEWLLPSQNQ